MLTGPLKLGMSRELLIFPTPKATPLPAFSISVMTYLFLQHSDQSLWGYLWLSPSLIPYTQSDNRSCQLPSQNISRILSLPLCHLIETIVISYTDICNMASYLVSCFHPSAAIICFSIATEEIFLKGVSNHVTSLLKPFQWLPISGYTS